MIFGGIYSEKFWRHGVWVDCFVDWWPIEFVANCKKSKYKIKMISKLGEVKFKSINECKMLGML